MWSLFLLIGFVMLCAEASHQHYQHINNAVVQRENSALSACDMPPDFWCDSDEAARQCNVVAQCQNLKRNNRPITVTLMYEAFCPFCQRFISNHLGEIYNSYRNYVNFELVPWGNSILLRNGKITCNHGAKECEANRMMSCVLAEVSNDQSIPFVVCFERIFSATETASVSVEQAFQQCSSLVRNAYRQIKQCYTSERGMQLQRQAAYRTMNASPNRINEVPYFLINNYSPKTDANTVNVIALKHLLVKWLNFRWH